MKTRTLSPSLLLLTLAGCSQSAINSPEITPDAPAEQGLETTESDELTKATSKSSYGDPNDVQNPKAEMIIKEAEAAPAPPTPKPKYTKKTEIYFESADIGGALGSPDSMGGLMSGSFGSRGSVAKGKSQAGGAAPAVRSKRAPGSAPYRGRLDTTQNTEQYTNYGVNDMTDASKDRFSTFSIDVDTASYTISRRKIQEGHLPPTASVRVEEFINYFPYTYDAPKGDAPFAVHMEASPDPFNDGHHLFRVGVKAKDLDVSNRKPVHLTFLVDVSGSMNRADKLGLAKRSLRLLTDQLRRGDTVALATYAGQVRAVLDPTDVANKSKIHAAIEDLSARGSTAMNSGIQLAYNMAQQGFVKGEENRVIVLSDGDANVGPSSHQEILKSIQSHAKRGITLSTIGLGMGNYKDTMMEQLANKGDGNYYYIDSFSEAKKVFGKDLAGTLQVIAKDVKLQVEFNPSVVASYRLIGYENRDIADRDFRNDKVDAGEIGTGHTVTALYDLVLHKNSGEDLATVRVRNKKPGPDSPAVEWMTAFEKKELKKEFSKTSADFQVAVSAATFAEVLRNSPYAAEISWDDLAQVASKAQRAGVSEDDELLSLIQRAASLSGPRGATAER